MNRVNYVSGVIERYVLIPDPVELVYIESIIRPMKFINDRLKYIVITEDFSAFLNATKCLHAEQFADRLEASLSLRCM